MFDRVRTKNYSPGFVLLFVILLFAPNIYAQSGTDQAVNDGEKNNIPKADTGHLILEKIKCFDFGKEFEGVKEVQFSKTGSSLIVKTMSKLDLFPRRLYHLDTSNGKSKVIIDPLHSRRGVVGKASNRLLWTVKDKKELLLNELPENQDNPDDLGTEHRIKLQDPEQFRSVVAGSIQHNFIVEEWRDDELRIVDLKSGKIKHFLKMGIVPDAVALSKDETLLAVCGMPQEAWGTGDQMENSKSSFVYVWNTKTGKLLYKRILGYRVFMVKFCADDSMLICSGGVIVYLEGETGEGHLDIIQLKKNGWSWHYHNAVYIQAADLIDNQHIAVGLESGKLQIINYKEAILISEKQAHPWNITSVTVKDNLIASGGHYGKVCLWELKKQAKQPNASGK
ncbi:MAG: hypothetical protein COA78_08305 [Blastopirellula sp.]|nr:MAG: hypothetical protein COA78_08305 [Blastopirellula sp.]